MTHSRTNFIAISLLLSLGLSACDKPGTAEKAGEKIDQLASDTGKQLGETVDKLENKLSDQGAKGAQAFDDTEITARVKAELLGDHGLKSMQISVETVKGVVRLTGTVDTKANSNKARARAMAMDGVRSVTNDLVVTPAK